MESLFHSQESLAAYLQCFSPTGSPDVAMQCRMCAAMLCRAGEDSVQRDCAQLIAHAATGPGLCTYFFDV